LESRGIELVLGDLDAGVECGGGVAGEDGDALLRDDFAGVDVLIDVVDGAAGFSYAGGERLFPGAQALERREQRRMDVDDAMGEGVEERFLDDAHVAGEDDPLGTVLAQKLDQRDFAFRAELGLERRREQRGSGEAISRGVLEDDGVRDVAGDEDDFGVELSRENRLLQRDKVAAFAGTEDGEAGGSGHGGSLAG